MQCGEGVPERTKGYFTSHLAAVSKVLHVRQPHKDPYFLYYLHVVQGYHVQVTARSDRDLTPEGIVQKVADASGAKYSGGGSVPSSGGPPPPISSKPKPFTPTRVGGGVSGFNPLGGARSRAPQPQGNTDNDGWGEDAPQVTRTQLEKVESAYKPTKVNMAELTSKKQEPSRFQVPQADDSTGDVVRGGYQPIGKVDIAAIRRAAKDSGQGQDDRPTPVKGSYEPVGKVDIAAIRAKAQGAPPPAPQPISEQSHDAEEDDRPKSLAERSAAFNQSGRLASLPKPKVANKFGGSGSFAGTKAPTPAGFTAKTVEKSAPVGIASRTFADQGGKTPAQLWAEKKAKEGGGAIPSPSSAAAPVAAQKSGGWESGYTGKKWGAVNTTHTGKSAVSQVSSQNTGPEQYQAEPAQPASPPGGISAIRDRFKDAPPIQVGAPPTARAVPAPAGPPSPPPLDTSSKPNAGFGGVPIPGLPTRPAEESEEEEDIRPSSPIRVAMPVGRETGHRDASAPGPEEPEESQPEPPSLPAQSIGRVISAARSPSPEPRDEDDDAGRGAAQAAAAATFGSSVPAAPAAASGGQRAVVQYDYEKAEDNEIELHEGDFVTNIDMVDEDWWMGTNAHGETGLFPSNYVELVEDEDAGGAPPAAAASAAAPPAASPAPAGNAGPTATAQYDYEAAEDNELSFPDGATVTGVVSSTFIYQGVIPKTDAWCRNSLTKTGGLVTTVESLDCSPPTMCSLTISVSTRRPLKSACYRCIHVGYF